MRIKLSFSILFFLFISLSVNSQKENKTGISSFKIVGYYFLYTAVRDTVHSDSSYLFLNKITHLNIAFINPDSAGNFRNDLAIDTLIKKAHQKNVKVLASIGGGGPHPYFSVLLDNKNRRGFIDNLVSLVKRYDLDGVDVDIEGDDIDKNYTKFVVGLAAALRQEKKLITAAIATAYKDQLPDKALKQFDFVNIMSYDNTGPWRPQDPGDPSTYSMAVDDLDYWHNTRGIPKEKLVLGLPFYGYGFGKDNSPVVSMNYSQIVSLYPNSELSDTLNLPGDVVMYYNNLATIKKKTELAMQKGGGVMIWQLLGDAPGNNSLLNAIYQVVHK
ncbi:MAG TPA: glycosyl hydrolase family 18 protein [Hanamia sp.]|nr:glycosyl hydrolase family 18 protein [Hanamia sp.]